MRASRHTATIIGLAAALVLTGAAFALVQVRLFGKPLTLRLIGVLATLQLLVHCRYFLELRFSRQDGERVMTLAFAVMAGLIMALGTLWIMSDLKHRMM